MENRTNTALDLGKLDPEAMAAHLKGANDTAGGTSEGPQPLFRDLPSAEPFPLHALGETLKHATGAIEAVIQCPMACAANSVLAVASLAAQGVANVILPIGQGKPAPLSLYFLTVLESGERKSSADSLALKPVRETEARLAEAGREERLLYSASLAAHEAKSKQLIAKHKADRAVLQAALVDLGAAPLPPIIPVIAPSGDQTMEGLFRVYQQGRPSLALLCDDAATFLGGHSLKAEQKAGSTANLCRAWDGAKLERIRGGDGVSVLHDRRLAAHLMVQPGVAAGFLSDQQFADQGLLARFLIAAPDGRAGTRFRNDSSYQSLAIRAAQKLEVYNQAITRLLDQPVQWKDPEDRALGVEMNALHFSADARRAYVEFANEVEADMGAAGKLGTVKAFASKLPENAGRIAGTLTLIDDPHASVIEAETLANAMELARFYLGEAMRLQAAGAIDPELQGAEKLRRWLLDRPADTIGLTEIYQLGPNAIRQADKARTAMHILEAHGCAHSIEGGAVINGKQCREAWAIVRA